MIAILPIASLTIIGVGLERFQPVLNAWVGYERRKQRRLDWTVPQISTDADGIFAVSLQEQPPAALLRLQKRLELAGFETSVEEGRWLIRRYRLREVV